MAMAVTERNSPVAGHHERTTVAHTRASRRGPRQDSLSSSCVGAALGVVLLLVATALLWANEGIAVRTARSLDEARAAVWEGALADAPSGALVHVVGKLDGERTLSDEDYGLRTRSLSLRRVAEVYQWKETKETHTKPIGGGRGHRPLEQEVTTYKYDSLWARHAIDSQGFHDPNFINPRWEGAIEAASSGTGLPFSASAWKQPSVQLAGLQLSAELQAMADVTQPISPQRLPEWGSGAILSGGHVYSSRDCSVRPRVGCVRLHWVHAPLQVVSVLAAAQRGRLVPWPNSQGDQYEIAKLSFGEHSAAAILSEAHAANNSATWIKRGAGLLLMWLGWSLLMGPASYIASWLPILGRLVGYVLAVVALCSAVVQSLTVIAIAWVVHRPLLGTLLLASAVAIACGGIRFAIHGFAKQKK